MSRALLIGGGLLIAGWYMKRTRPESTFAQLLANFTRGPRLTVTKLGTGTNAPEVPEDEEPEAYVTETIWTPPAQLVAEASEQFGETVTAEEYALARMIASENGDAPIDENRCRMWVAHNDARALGGWDLQRLMTFSSDARRKGYFGRQRTRRYATSADPHTGDVQLARVVLAEIAAGAPDPTDGATKFVNVGAFGHQAGTGSFAALKAKWESEGYTFWTVDGITSDLVFAGKA